MILRRRGRMLMSCWSRDIYHNGLGGELAWELAGCLGQIGVGFVLEYRRNISFLLLVCETAETQHSFTEALRELSSFFYATKNTILF